MSSTENNSNSLYRYGAVILQAVVYLYAFNLFAYTTADPDLWGHIKFGEQIWLSGSLTETNFYSYTAPDHPWINHEWLTEVIFYLIYKYTGSTGLLAFKLALGMFTVYLLTNLCLKRENNVLLYTFNFFLIIPVMAPGFMMRPHLITFLCLTILIYMLYEFIDGNHRPIMASPVLFLFWTNCHGGVVAGIGIYGLVAGIGGVQGWLLRKDNHYKKLLVCFAISCMAMLIHPQGMDLWVFLYHTLSLPRDISEWNPVPILTYQFWEFKLLVILLFTTLMRNTPKRFWELAIVAVAVIYGFKHQRHTVITMIVIAPYIHLQFSEIIRDWNLADTVNKLSSGFHQAIFITLIIFGGIQLYSGINKYRESDYEIMVPPNMYPVYAAQFIKANNIKGNILAPFDWGEYIIWNLPDSKVSVDGRFRTAYPEELINQNLSFSAGGTKWRALLNEYPTEIVLTRKSDKTHEYLSAQTDWLKIYEDIISTIHIKKESPQKPIQERFNNKELIQIDSPPSFLFP